MPLSVRRSYRAAANAISRGEGWGTLTRIKNELQMSPAMEKSGDLFRSLYNHRNIDCAANLLSTSNGSKFFDYELSTMVPAAYMPRVHTASHSTLLPTRAVYPNDWQFDGYFDHIAYDNKGNPIPSANHLISRYKGYLDNPEMQNKDIKLTPLGGPHYHMGFLITHYGHFILEVLTRYWHALQTGVDPNTIFVFHIWQRDIENALNDALKNRLFKGYWADYLNALGLSQENTLFLTHPTSFHSITLPQYAVSLSASDCFISDAALPVWRFLNSEMSAAYYTNNPEKNFGDRVYISRRKVANPNRGRVYSNEAEIEDLFRSKGFFILYPEDLESEYEKQAVLSNVRFLAGAPGSGLLSSVFIPHQADVLMIISEQAYKTNPAVIHQIAMNTLVGHRTHAYFEHDLAMGSEPQQPPINLTKLEKALDKTLSSCL